MATSDPEMPALEAPKPTCAVMGLSIAPARCRGVMDTIFKTDPAVKALVKTTKDELKTVKEQTAAAAAALETASKKTGAAARSAKETAAAQVAKNEARAAELETQLKELTKDHIRIGGQTPVAAASVGHWLTTSLVRAAMDETIKRAMKTVTVDDFLAAAAGSTPAFCLVRPLAGFAPAAPAPVLAADAAADATAAAAEPEPKLKFATYVDVACDMTRASAEEYAGLRFSRKFRTHMAALVQEFMVACTELFRQVVVASKSRTLTTANILLVVTLLLTHAGYSDAATEVSQFVTETVSARLHAKSEEAAETVAAPAAVEAAA